jgi:hypothetical protein
MEEKYKLLKDKEKLKNTLDGRDTVAVAEYDNKVKELNRKDRRLSETSRRCLKRKQKQ